MSLGIATFAFAQATKFKEISKLSEADFQNEKSTLEPDAPAEILFRSMHHRIETNGDIITNYVERIRIYNKNKADKFLNPEISVYEMDGGQTQRLMSLTANTYNLENGKIVATKVEKDSKFRSKEDKNYTITKFAFNNVKDGSVVEYKYEISSPQQFLMMMPRFMVEQEIPAKYVD